MTNNDELAMKLKAAAYRVKEFGGIANYSKSVGVETVFRQEATPENILALLAERDADKKRIAELEARTVSVKLPKTIWYEHDDLAIDVAVLEKRLVKKALREACAASGIKLKVGE